MLLISNLGNTEGRDLEREGTKAHIGHAMDEGFCVHLNVWKLPGTLSIGVDYPSEAVTPNLLNLDKTLCRAMNISALQFMLQEGIHCYWRAEDDFTISNRGFVLSFSQVVIPGSIVMRPEECLLDDLSKKDYVGICSDFIKGYQT